MQELADIRVGRKFAFTLLNGEQVFCYVKADDSGYYIAHDHLPPVFLFDLADIDAPVFQQRILGYLSPVCDVPVFPRCKTLDDLKILLYHLLRQLLLQGITGGLQDAIRLPEPVEAKRFDRGDFRLPKSWNGEAGMVKHEAAPACKKYPDPVKKILPMPPVILSKNNNEPSLLLITN
ncbi:MAG: hypothetical protein LBG31_05210 [Prevotellaceae bacterium]|jgi:hypothetical protein|nr:hypothetical protein [Prevotellaceae bacterium]